MSEFAWSSLSSRPRPRQTDALVYIGITDEKKGFTGGGNARQNKCLSKRLREYIFTQPLRENYAVQSRTPGHPSVRRFEGSGSGLCSGLLRSSILLNDKLSRGATPTQTRENERRILRGREAEGWPHTHEEWLVKLQLGGTIYACMT